MNIFENGGRFFRGNLHTHSTRSDGALEPAELCRRYRDEGYDFLVLSDHLIGTYDYPIVDTSAFRTDDFTTIIGAEVHAGTSENGGLWHILAVGLPLDFAPPNAPGWTPVAGQETGAALARRCFEAGAFVAIAHPQWSGLTLADAMSIDAAHAVEIYNHSSAVAADRSDGWHIADRLLSAGRRVTAIATDDAHFSRPDHFHAWVMVKAEQNEPDILLSALKEGAFYSTQGPELRSIELEGDSVTVRSSACVTVIAQGAGSAAVSVHGHSMTTATIPLKRCENSPWVRVTIIDASGRRAWSNPMWR